MAQLCGLEFKTTKNRKFKCVALNRMLFKTPYDVDVGTGICRGVLLKRKPSGNFASLNPVFLDLNPL